MDIIYLIGGTLLVATLFMGISLFLVQFLVVRDNPFRRVLTRLVGAEKAELIIRDDLSDNNRIFKAYQEYMNLMDNK